MTGSSPNVESTGPTRVLVADQNRMVSQLLAESLARDQRFEIVAVATAADVLPMAANRQPHVALISEDLDSRAKKGFQIARNLHSRHPFIRIVMLLETGTRESVIAAFRCGATGVFCRSDPLAELPTCIERVARAEIWASRNHSEFLLEALRNTPSCEGITAAKIELLSHRELQVAEHAAQGHSNKQIAYSLGLSEHTIKNYLFRIFEKLEVSNRFELLFLLFKECNGQATDKLGVLGTEIGKSIETYLKAAEEGSITAQFVVGLAYLEGHGIEQNGVSAYYWLRVAEDSSSEFGLRSRALVDQLRNMLKANELEGLEHRIAAAVKNNKLLKSQRPVEFIKHKGNLASLGIAV